MSVIFSQRVLTNTHIDKNWWRLILCYVETKLSSVYKVTPLFSWSTAWIPLRNYLWEQMICEYKWHPMNANIWVSPVKRNSVDVECQKSCKAGKQEKYRKACSVHKTWYISTEGEIYCYYINLACCWCDLSGTCLKWPPFVVGQPVSQDRLADCQAVFSEA